VRAKETFFFVFRWQVLPSGQQADIPREMADISLRDGTAVGTQAGQAARARGSGGFFRIAPQHVFLFTFIPRSRKK
jgi:hypothetical protein